MVVFFILPDGETVTASLDRVPLAGELVSVPTAAGPRVFAMGEVLTALMDGGGSQAGYPLVGLADVPDEGTARRWLDRLGRLPPA